MTFTVACSGRALNAHMKMVIVVPPWAHLGQPAPVIAGLFAQHFLDGWMHKDAVHLWIGRRALDELGMEWGPLVGIDGEWILEH